MIKIRPLALTDFEDPPEHTVRGLSFFNGDQKVGMVYVARLMGNQWLMLDIQDNSFAMKRALIKGWVSMKKIIQSPTYTEQDAFVTAKGLIEHFGFCHFKDKVWVI